MSGNNESLGTINGQDKNISQIFRAITSVPAVLEQRRLQNHTDSQLARSKDKKISIKTLLTHFEGSNMHPFV